MIVNSDQVFDTVRRGYNDLQQASNDEIASYFDEIDADAMIGHVSNIKGILFEKLYVEQLAEQGVHAELFDATNHPIADVAIFGHDEVTSELQLKATDSVAYINAALEQNPEVAVVVTTEVAKNMDAEMVIDSGIENAVLESAVTETLFDEVVNPVSPLSVFGWIIGLPF